SIPAMDFFKTSSADDIVFAQPSQSPAVALKRYVTLYLDPRWNHLLISDGAWPHLTTKTALPVTLPLVPELIGFLNIFVFHAGLLLLPLVYFFSRQSRPLTGFLLFVTIIVAYLSGVGSIAEFSENMRFRLAVEPLIWINSIGVVLAFVRVSRERWRRRHNAGEPGHAATNPVVSHSGNAP